MSRLCVAVPGIRKSFARRRHPTASRQLDFATVVPLSRGICSAWSRRPARRSARRTTSSRGQFRAVAGDVRPGANTGRQAGAVGDLPCSQRLSFRNDAGFVRCPAAFNYCGSFPRGFRDQLRLVIAQTSADGETFHWMGLKLRNIVGMCRSRYAACRRWPHLEQWRTSRRCIVAAVNHSIILASRGSVFFLQPRWRIKPVAQRGSLVRRLLSVSLTMGPRLPNPSVERDDLLRVPMTWTSVA